MKNIYVCVYFHFPDLLDNWYFLLAFMIQLLEDCSVKHQFGKYWFGKKDEQIHPGAGDKSELDVLFNYNKFLVLIMPPIPTPPKGMNMLCPHFLLESWFWATLLYLLIVYLFIASHSTQLWPNLVVFLTYFCLSLYFRLDSRHWVASLWS